MHDPIYIDEGLRQFRSQVSRCATRQSTADRI